MVLLKKFPQRDINHKRFVLPCNKRLNYGYDDLYMKLIYATKTLDGSALKVTFHVVFVYMS